MIAAIILAAGESRRMGSPKALLRYHDTSFIEHILDCYEASSIAHLIVVTSPRAKDIQEQLAGRRVTFAINPNPAAGQLSSLVAGLDASGQFTPDAVVVHPVDHPAVSAVVIQSLAERYSETGRPIIIPVHQGRRGHPVLFSSAMFPALRAAPPDIGARYVVRSRAGDVLEVDSDDDGILLDIDERGDYERLMGR